VFPYHQLKLFSRNLTVWTEEPTVGPVTDTATHAAREIRVVLSRLRRRLKDVAGIGDLTPSQVSVLSRLDKGGPASGSDLAAAEGIRPQSLAATLAVLDQHGMIRRDPDPDDGRRQLVSLSAEGRERLEGTRQAREEWLVQALQERYTEAERRTIVEALALLDRLTEQ
jgi:DNA-binding MarR family transcriptional regulator